MNTSALRIALILSLCTPFASSTGGQDADRFSEQMTVSPWKGEGSSKGEYEVRNPGMGTAPSGYGMEHEPGEIAEFHLFVPKGLSKDRRYPLLIIYHGGRDGQSGEKLCRAWARASTKSHPLIVLSPNMYTMDAYDQLIAEGEVPIDERRVFVIGFSSGGRGLSAAARKHGETGGRFSAAGLIAASTKLRSDGTDSPLSQYVVMVGEYETPERSRDAHLGTVRRLCREHIVDVRASFPTGRYIEIEAMGHRINRPEHHAVLQNLIAASERPRPKFALKKYDPAFEPLVTLTRLGRFEEVVSELVRLDAETDAALVRAYTTVRRKVVKALDDWLEAGVKLVSKLSGNASHVEVSAALGLVGELEAALERYEPVGGAERRAKLAARIEGAERLHRELEARELYLAAIALEERDALRDALATLRESHADTEFGGNRTREMLLALEL